MQALIVYCHPEPLSFNGALKNVAVKTLSRLGYDVVVSDLYGECFDPTEKPAHYEVRQDSGFFAPLAEQRHASGKDRLPVEVRREISRLQAADIVILQFPLWWHGPPAMLKGWFDRVFVNGGLYTSTMRYDRGYFRPRRVLCSLTTGAPEEAFRPGGRGGDIERLLWPIHFSLYYMGFSVLPSFLAYGVQGYGYKTDGENRQKVRLENYQDLFARRLEGLGDDEPLSFPGWQDWDERGAPKPA